MIRTRAMQPVLRASMRSSNNDALITAVSLGDVADVRAHLLNPLTNPNTGDGLPLRTAIENSHPYIALVLLSDSRVDPSLNNNAALMLAIESNDVQLITTLLRDERVVQQLKRKGLNVKHSVSLRVVQLVRSAISQNK